MRRSFAIFLTIIFLFSTLVPLQAKEEMAKLSSLLEHFRGHKTETPEITLMQFLEMHYGDEFCAHNDDHNHSDLPLKNACRQFHLTTSVVLPLSPAFYPVAPATINPGLTSYSDQSYSFLFLSDIWQPPKN